MTGFIRGLFGGNKQPSAPKPPSPRGAFFLDEDDAKTFGDINYMRSEKVVKRTFARKKGQTEEIETVRRVSAMRKQDLDERGGSNAGERAAEPSTTSSSEVTFESARRFSNTKVDSNMDMFRNMARDIKKR